MRSSPFILLALMVVAVLNTGCSQRSCFGHEQCLSHPFYPTKPVKIDTNFGVIKPVGTRIILKVKL